MKRNGKPRGELPRKEEKHKTGAEVKKMKSEGGKGGNWDKGVALYRQKPFCGKISHHQSYKDS